MTAFINGTDFAEYGVRVLAGSQHDALPETRDRTITVPGRHGAYDFGADLGVRQFELKCALIDATDPADLQQKLRLLTAELTDAYGRPKTFELSFSEEPEKHYRVRYSGRVAVDRIYKLGLFSLPLTAYDPASYAGMNAYDPLVQPQYDSGFEYGGENMYANTVSFNWAYPKHYSGFRNYSEYTTPVAMEIYGSVSNPSVTNLNTGERLMLPSITNATLTVGLDKTVLVNGSNALDDYLGDFIIATPGNVSLLFEGENPNCQVTYEWKHKFI